MQRRKGTGGHEVRGCEHRIDVGMPPEEDIHRALAALAGELATLFEALVEWQTCRAECVTISPPAGDAGGHVLGAQDRGNPDPSLVDQMSYGREGAAVIVVVDVTDARAPRRLAADDDRDALGVEVLRQRVVAVQREEDDAVDVAAREVALGPAFFLRGL